MMNKSIFVSFILCITLAQAGSVFNMKFKEKMTVDFLTGFESGLFMRNNTQHFDEYGCPTSHPPSKDLAVLKQAIAPIKNLNNGAFTGGKPLQEVADMINTVELFVDSLDKFIGVFDEEYNGGDFCAGITFGM